MSVVFVLTNKGWRNEQDITTKEQVYCFDPKTKGLDLQPVKAIYDISGYDTWHVYNRLTNYGTYVNENTGIVLIDEMNQRCYQTTVAAIDQRRSMMDEVYIPSRIECVNKTVRQIIPNRQYERDVKLREIGMWHFDFDRQYAKDYINKWKTHHQRLNAVDYNQAVMIQLVALKSGKLSSIEHEIGFNVKLVDAEYTRVTDASVSSSIKITRRFEGEKGTLVPIRQINGKTMIG